MAKERNTSQQSDEDLLADLAEDVVAVFNEIAKLPTIPKDLADAHKELMLTAYVILKRKGLSLPPPWDEALERLAHMPDSGLFWAPPPEE